MGFNERKKVTVVVPVYNATAYIENTINSVINQTLDKEMYHILVVNDGSTDDSGEKLENIRNKYSDVIEIINQKN
ncbi:MAG: glycosyltransferase family 2 protein, partial [Lactococcus plantarum]|nr:glycosyltransferase family 2 protein [Lactococcus plantarum]